MSDGKLAEHFLREAHVAAGLNHPNIVTIHNIQAIYVLITGGTLYERYQGKRIGLVRLLMLTITVQIGE